LTIAPCFRCSIGSAAACKAFDERGIVPLKVLGWTNDGCQFVGKHCDSGNMQVLQQKYTAAGVVWLTIASFAPGEQGYVTPAEAKADLACWRAAPTDFLLDPDGTVGRLYDTHATPQMVVIDCTGRLVYRVRSATSRRPARRSSPPLSSSWVGSAPWATRNTPRQPRTPAIRSICEKLCVFPSSQWRSPYARPALSRKPPGKFAPAGVVPLASEGPRRRSL
jgi:hypothetical protein